MKLPSKQELKGLVQFSLLLYMTINGFTYTYMYLWCVVSSPNGWPFYVATTVLGMLSGFGLFHWIARN